jgi:DNA mismatch repair protein MSH4
MQVADCQTYVKTLLHLSLHSPEIIIAPDTFFATNRDGSYKSVLLEHIQEDLAGVPIVQFPRRFWNDRAGQSSPIYPFEKLILLSGLDFAKELSLEDEEQAGLILSIHDRYYALQAVGAVFKYIEANLNTVYPPRTLVIKYRTIEGDSFWNDKVLF